MENARRSKYTSSDSTTDSGASSYYSEESESSSSSSRSPSYGVNSRGLSRSGLEALEMLEEEDYSDIEQEIRGTTDEITVPLTVCVVIMIR